MEYLNKSFSVGGADSTPYADNFEATFGKQYECRVCVKKFRAHAEIEPEDRICDQCLRDLVCP